MKESSGSSGGRPETGRDMSHMSSSASWGEYCDGGSEVEHLKGLWCSSRS
ncbi:MAG TPA: hypothetical protein PKH33_16915 [bacterium]|nr:hypothetical protein [bacterium]